MGSYLQVHVYFPSSRHLHSRCLIPYTGWDELNKLASCPCIFLYWVDLSIITFDNQAANVLVFIAQLVAAALKRGGLMFESRWSPEIFPRSIRNCLHCYYNCDDHINSFEVCLVVQDTDWGQHGGNHLVIFMKDSKTDAWRPTIQPRRWDALGKALNGSLIKSLIRLIGKTLLLEKYKTWKVDIWVDVY